MRRFVVPLIIVAMLAVPLSASAAPRSTLLAASQLRRGYTRASLSAADTQYCPLTAFRHRAGSAQVAFSNDADPLTVVAERVVTTPSPASVFARNLAVIASCHHVSRTVGGVSVSERLARANFGAYGFSTRAYVATVNAEGIIITGAIFYAAEGKHDLILVEVTNGPFSHARFRTLIKRAVGALAA